MKYSKSFAAGLLLMAFIFVVAGCGKKAPTATNSMAKTSTVLMKAAVSPTVMSTDVGSGTLLSSIPIPGGTLDVSAALINLDHVLIEENTGNDVEQDGEHNGGEKGGADNEAEGPDNEKGGPEAEQDIIVNGPFALDISNGEAAIQSVDVYPGTFKKVDLTLSINTASPFNGKTIVISGSFTPTGGSAVPVNLKSEFSQEIQMPIAGGGITVPGNSTVAVTITFNLAGWFDKVDLTSAQISNGEILIDSANNTALLSAFESNLTKYVDVEDSTEP